MPTYQYRCTNCDRDLEVVQKFTDPSLTECPECSGALKKVFNAVGVVFKGSGFYRTDSRSGSSTDVAKTSASNGSSTSETAASTSSSSTKADSGSNGSSATSSSKPASSSSTPAKATANS